jgi:hypothetical protein
MANLSADRPYETSGTMRAIRAKMTTGVTYYKGGIVVFTAAGGLGIKPTDVVNQGHVSGIVTKQKAAVAGDDLVELEIGKVWIPFPSAAQADVGDYVYATDDSTIAMSATNSNPIGRVVDVRVGVASLVDLEQGIVKTALA